MFASTYWGVRPGTWGGSASDGLTPYVSRTLVLSNLHPTTNPEWVVHSLLDRLVDLDPRTISEVRLHTVQVRGRYERHAFVEFNNIAHTQWVHRHIDEAFWVPCPPPCVTTFGYIHDEAGRLAIGAGLRVVGDTSTSLAPEKPTRAVSEPRTADAPERATSPPILLPSKRATTVEAQSLLPRPRYYTLVHSMIWPSYIGHCDPAANASGWECLECKLPNYKRQNFCYRCGVGRPSADTLVYRLSSSDGSATDANSPLGDALNEDIVVFSSTESSDERDQRVLNRPPDDSISMGHIEVTSNKAHGMAQKPYRQTRRRVGLLRRTKQPHRAKQFSAKNIKAWQSSTNDEYSIELQSWQHDGTGEGLSTSNIIDCGRFSCNICHPCNTCDNHASYDDNRRYDDNDASKDSDKGDAEDDVYY